MSTGSSSKNINWEWNNAPKQTRETVSKKSKEAKEESLISFETDNKKSEPQTQNWNSKLEDDAWEILNN